LVFLLYPFKDFVVLQDVVADAVVAEEPPGDSDPSLGVRGAGGHVELHDSPPCGGLRS
jgi:hypothetical protein